MRILLIGGTGVIGKAVAKELSQRHEVEIVGHKQGQRSCDLASESSLRNLFENAGVFQAVAVAAGNVHFEEFQKMNLAKYQIGLNHKLMGQVNCVLIGSQFIQPNGSFTLISGTLCDDPIRAGSSASMVNGAINSFVKAAAIELPSGLRINAVCPTVLIESLPSYGPYFPGHEAVPAHRVALAYSKSIEGAQTGQIYRVA